LDSNWFLGVSVALSFDGKRIAIGAIELGFPDNGHVRMYQETSGNWSQLGLDINTNYHGLFGWSVSLSASGNRVVVGAYSAEGYVTVYEELFGSWNQVGDTIRGVAYGDHLGNAVSISDDGKFIAVGASGGGSGGNGLVRIYEEVNGSWNPFGVDIDGNPGSLTGTSVSFSGDGTRVGVGSPARVYDLYITSSIGEQEVPNQFDFQLYPNPTNSFVTLEIDNIQISYTTIELIASNGSVLKRMEADVQSGKTRMDLSPYSDGD